MFEKKNQNQTMQKGKALGQLYQKQFILCKKSMI